MFLFVANWGHTISLGPRQGNKTATGHIKNILLNFFLHIKQNIVSGQTYEARLREEGGGSFESRVIQMMTSIAILLAGGRFSNLFIPSRFKC